MANTLQQAAYQAAYSREELADEMTRRDLGRKIKNMDPNVLASIAGHLGGGRKGDGGTRGVSASGVVNGGVSPNNPGKIDVPNIDRDANHLKEIQIANAEEDLFQKRDKYKRENPTLTIQQESDLESEKRSKRMDDFMNRSLSYNAMYDSKYTGEGSGSPYEAALQQRVATGGDGGDRVVVRDDKKTQAALLKYIAAEKYLNATKATLDPKKIAAATAALEKAKANYQAVDTVFGGGQEDAKSAAPASASWIPPTDDTAIGGNTPAALAAIYAKYKAAGMTVPGQEQSTAAPAVGTWSPADEEWKNQVTLTPQFSSSAKGQPPELGDAPAPITPDMGSTPVESSTKMVNGNPYRKVSGGWELVNK